MAESWVSAGDGGSILHVHVRPGAARSGVVGLHGEALAVRVAARPVDGVANRELLAVLAEALGIGRTALRVTSGARGRDKRIHVQGLEPATVLAKLRPFLRV